MKLSTASTLRWAVPGRRLGWLGPTVILVGLAVGGFGVWWMMRARPEPGPVIDALALDDEWAVVVRRERGTPRAFVELYSAKSGTRWSALVPAYAGRPGVPAVAASQAAVSVRVSRDDGPELWALSAKNATKLGAISLSQYAKHPLVADPDVVTRADLARGLAFEVLTGTERSTVVAVDLERGAVTWHREVAGRVTAIDVGPTAITVALARAASVGLAIADGAPVDVPVTPINPLVLTFDPPLGWSADRRIVTAADGATRPWPSGALDPKPYHVARGGLWQVRPDRVIVLDPKTLQ
jgi:hypothetical protein